MPSWQNGSKLDGLLRESKSQMPTDYHSIAISICLISKDSLLTSLLDYWRLREKSGLELEQLYQYQAELNNHVQELRWGVCPTRYPIPTTSNPRFFVLTSSNALNSYIATRLDLCLLCGCITKKHPLTGNWPNAIFQPTQSCLLFVKC